MKFFSRLWQDGCQQHQILADKAAWNLPGNCIQAAAGFVPAGGGAVKDVPKNVQYVAPTTKRGGFVVEYFKVGLPYIRTRFKVPARRGSRVELHGRFGTIRGSSGEYLLVKFDGEEAVVIVHPVEPNYVENGEATERPSPPPQDTLAQRGDEA